MEQRVPGLLVVTAPGADSPPGHFATILSREGLPALSPLGGSWVSAWGLTRSVPEPLAPLLLSGTNRSGGSQVPPTKLADWLADGDRLSLGRMLPPFGALGVVPEGLRIATDDIGFQQVFRCDGPGWQAVSTSARLLAALLRTGPDLQAWLLQSQLGWQLADLTVFAGVRKVTRGAGILITPNGQIIEESTSPAVDPGSVGLDEAVTEAASILRHFLEEYLDETPDPTIQLTGGQDSRLVLSAIPPSRRRGLRAMTLDVPGGADTAVAARLCAREGLIHIVHGLSRLQTLDPAEAFSRTLQEARRHECMTDPLARAATALGEESFEQAERLAGLGGELARGFYYLGRVRRLYITRGRAERLARWRMLSNEAVEPEMLAPGVREQALPSAVDLVHRALIAGGPEWYSATDDLYFNHRTARWAGLCESVVSLRRTITNPLLDNRFLRLARNLAPQDKANAQFLGRLQVALDPGLAGEPLDNRPPPSAYAQPTVANHLRITGARLERLAGKTRQRLARRSRPSAGTASLGSQLRVHLTNEPQVLDPARNSGLLDEPWLDGVADGSIRPSPASLALLMNLIAADDSGAS